MRMRMFQLIAVGAVCGSVMTGAPSGALRSQSRITIEHQVVAQVDDTAQPPAYLAPDGHIVVTGRRLIIWAPDNQRVELAPGRVSTEPKPLTLVSEVDGIRRDQRDLDGSSDLPSMSYAVDSQAVGHKRVRLYLVDENNGITDLMNCILNAAFPMQRPSLVPERHGESVEIHIPGRSDLGSVYLFVDGAYQGRLAASAQLASVDTRLLAPGPHRIGMVAVTDGMVLLPPAAVTITVAPRFQIDVPAALDATFVGASDAGKSIQVRIRRAADVPPTYRLFVAGSLVMEGHQADTTATVPLRDVPTGQAPVEVVGVAADGTLYAPDAVSITVKNEIWEQAITSTPEYASIQDKEAQVKSAQQDSDDWWFKLFSTPEFVEANQSHVGQFRRQDGSIRHDEVDHYDSYTNIYWPYVSTQARASIRRDRLSIARLDLDIGRLWLQLRAPSIAAGYLDRAERAADPTSELAAAARAELSALNAARAAASLPH